MKVEKKLYTTYIIMSIIPIYIITLSTWYNDSVELRILALDSLPSVTHRKKVPVSKSHHGDTRTPHILATCRTLIYN